MVEEYWVLDEAHRGIRRISMDLPTSPAEDYVLCSSAKVNPHTRGCSSAPVTFLSNVHRGQQRLIIEQSSRCMSIFLLITTKTTNDETEPCTEINCLDKDSSTLTRPPVINPFVLFASVVSSWTLESSPKFSVLTGHHQTYPYVYP